MIKLLLSSLFLYCLFGIVVAKIFQKMGISRIILEEMGKEEDDWEEGAEARCGVYLFLMLILAYPLVLRKFILERAIEVTSWGVIVDLDKVREGTRQ